MFVLYSILFTIGFVLMTPLFLLRREKYAAGIRQRFGVIPKLRQTGKPVIWIHCVSVGETNAAVPLINALQEEFPGFRIVISTTTRTGQELAKKLFADKASLIFYFPFDWKFTVRRALRNIRPDIVLLMETELWFNFIRQAKARGAQIFIVNGRLSEKSAARYRMIRGMMSRVLRRVDLALMQTGGDAQRLLRLGINPKKVRITGNLKFDQPLPARDGRFITGFAERFALSKTSPLIVAASTHAPEERLILEAFKKIYKDEIRPRLLIAPRHPERFDEIAAAIERGGFKLARRSNAPAADDGTADVILLDSIGELRHIFPLAEIVFVGGSLIPHGGQNILEAAIARKAIVTGFYTVNFAEIVNTFERKKAVIRLPKLAESEIPDRLAEVFRELLQDDQKRRELARNAFELMEKNRGATEKTIKFLRPVLQVQNKAAPASNFPAQTRATEIPA